MNDERSRAVIVLPDLFADILIVILYNWGNTALQKSRK